jgi:hypothetical protein
MVGRLVFLGFHAAWVVVNDRISVCSSQLSETVDGPYGDGVSNWPRCSRPVASINWYTESYVKA